MYEGRGSRYYYRITDRTTGQVVKEGYVTGGSKADCEEAAKLIKIDLRRELGLSAARDEDRERLKVYLKAAPAEPEKRRTIEQVRQISGMNRMAFARAYGIPYRTITDWEHGLRQPPEWLAGILEKAVRYDQANE